MDANSGLAILGTAIGSAKLIEKVLGPTAEYLGAGLRDFAQHRVANVKRIFEKANTFLGDNPPIDQAVPPRVLRDVFYSRSHAAVIRIYDDAGNVIETHEHKRDF